jgi:hypothetical protein
MIWPQILTPVFADLPGTAARLEAEEIVRYCALLVTVVAARKFRKIK